MDNGKMIKIGIAAGALLIAGVVLFMTMGGEKPGERTPVKPDTSTAASPAAQPANAPPARPITRGGVGQ
jgi:hypothetical protein